ncbi:LysR family transcriptional regulator [Legionella sp. W05-934-2]|jgi:DNA-binding transcriptional LysR family regulator|uniref:LysR family transcriptional regulator n=1 Tax=Legionella sp. W05-934-2 TaxID=1198649 RepID=UPI0034626CE2
MLPSANELVYFIEVSNCLNLSRASERLGISQPSLSLAIKRLEQSIGIPLFIRHKQGVSLTQAGKQLVVHARQLLQYWENTRSKALASHHFVQGFYTIGCHSVISSYLLADFLPKLLAKHPKLEIHLRHDISRKITEEVINLSCDLAIIVNPIEHPDLVIKKLCQDKVTFWVKKDLSPLQMIQDPNAVILCDPSLTQTQWLLKQRDEAGIKAKRLMTSNSLEAIVNLALTGCGIAILPERVANRLGNNELIPIANAPAYEDDICLVYRHENRDLMAMQTIIESLKAHIKAA